MDPIAKKNIDLWLQENYDEQTKAEIRRLVAENPQEAVDAFYTNLSFGTGGMRGVMGVGTNRMNNYTIRAATQGLANYLKKEGNNKSYKVLIGYDSRHHSREFAIEAAKVLAGNGIYVYIFRELRPTPLVSFGCRYKKCNAAIMITASHNPSEYNGYKVYWDDGGQVLPPHDIGIIEEVNKITDVNRIKFVKKIENPLIEWIQEEIDNAYLLAIMPLQNYPEECKKEGPNLRVVYTSLHGTGITMVPPTLKSWGFSHITFVKDQVIPDGDFPTAKYPNPEIPDTLKRGIQTLKQTNGELLIATDPDADRVGVVVNHHGSIVTLTGNQLACVLLHHLCETYDRQKKMPKRAGFVKTIGTTELFHAIVDDYGKKCFDVLTGFKYIAEVIRTWEEHPENGYQYLFGGEESCGYLYGTNSRDKDAVLSSALVCEAAVIAKKEGKTLVDRLEDLFKKFGVFEEKLLSIEFEDTKEGKEEMSQAMEELRKTPLKEIYGIPVIAQEDYLNSVRIYSDRRKEPLLLPRSDVLLFWLQDRSKVMIRPSGTEPKVKIYCGVRKEMKNSMQETINECQKKADELLDFIHNMMKRSPYLS